MRVNAVKQRLLMGALWTSLVLVASPACGAPKDLSSEGTSSTGAPSTRTASPTPDPMAGPSLTGRLPVGPGPRRLAITCWGAGSPVVMFDAGSGDAGIARWRSSPVTAALARRTTVCAYDRAGLGESDPAPNRKRVLDDIAADLHALLRAAKIPSPHVMVGSSGGGGNIYHHAGRYPDDVDGLVMLDVPAAQARFSAADVEREGLSWNSPTNPERVDYVTVERQLALNRLSIPPIPVTVVTARFGQSEDPKEQKTWLTGSSRPRQVVLEGGHEIYADNPAGVTTEIEKVLDFVSAKRGSSSS